MKLVFCKKERQKKVLFSIIDDSLKFVWEKNLTLETPSKLKNIFFILNLTNYIRINYQNMEFIEESKNEEIIENKNIPNEEEYNADETFDCREFEDENGIKHINEYEKCEKLGNGSYGKVFRVIRSFFDDDGKIAKSSYAMKIFHKATLINQRFMVYETEKQEEAKMSTYLDQVSINKYIIIFN